MGVRWEHRAGGGRASSGPGSASSGRLPSGRLLCFPLASRFGERWVDKCRRSGWEGTDPTPCWPSRARWGGGGRQEVDRPETEGGGAKRAAPWVCANAAGLKSSPCRGPRCRDTRRLRGVPPPLCHWGLWLSTCESAIPPQAPRGPPPSQEMQASSGAQNFPSRGAQSRGQWVTRRICGLVSPESSRLWLRETLTPSSSL